MKTRDLFIDIEVKLYNDFLKKLVTLLNEKLCELYPEFQRFNAEMSYVSVRLPPFK